ncbi:hypothetical protein [Oceanobacillus neutriphilus]|nr:hypothetical protein [Oceanobacillus neutriphilus]
MLKSQIDYQVEDVRKTMEQCKNKKKKHKVKNWEKSYFRLEREG